MNRKLHPIRSLEASSSSLSTLCWNFAAAQLCYLPELCIAASSSSACSTTTTRRLHEDALTSVTKLRQRALMRNIETIVHTRACGSSSSIWSSYLTCVAAAAVAIAHIVLEPSSVHAQQANASVRPSVRRIHDDDEGRRSARLCMTYSALLLSKCAQRAARPAKRLCTKLLYVSALSAKRFNANAF